MIQDAQKAPKALIFDMDGTMVDSMPFHAESWLLFAKQQGLTIDLADLMDKTTGRTGHECMEILLNRPLDAVEANRLIAAKEHAYRELFGPKFKEVAGFTHFASMARAQGFKLGVGTAGDQHNIAFVLKNLRLNFEFDAIVGGDQGYRGKPHPDIFLAVSERLQVKPRGCVVFEDAPLGIEAARQAGMKAVAITTSHSAAVLAGPHVIAATANFNRLSVDQLFIN